MEEKYRTTVEDQFLPLASQLFGESSLLIDREIVHILDVDNDSGRINVHFPLLIDGYVLQENASDDYRHLFDTRIDRYIVFAWKMTDEKRSSPEKKTQLGNVSSSHSRKKHHHYLPKLRADRFVCVIRHFHFSTMTPDDRIRGSCSRITLNRSIESMFSQPWFHLSYFTCGIILKFILPFQ